MLLHPFPRFSDAAPQGNGRLPAECCSCPGNIQHHPWHIEVAARLVDRFQGVPCGLADDVDDLRDGRAFATSGVEAAGRAGDQGAMAQVGNVFDVNEVAARRWPSPQISMGASSATLRR